MATIFLLLLFNQCINKMIVNTFKYNVLQSPSVLHLDVEPHALDEWDTDKIDIANQYLDLIDKINYEFIIYNSELSLRMDIPRWYDNHNITRYNNNITKALSSFVLDTSNVLIMDYVDTTYRFIRDSKNELMYGDTLMNNNIRENVQISVAVETGCNIDPLTVTFCDDGSNILENVLQESYNNLTKYLSFEQLAIHDYNSYYILEPDYIILNCSNRYRALYCWNWETAINSSSGFLEFCHNHCVNKIYLESQTLLSNDYYQQKLAIFLNKTYLFGIQIELVLGYHIWARQINHNDCLKYVDWAIQFVNNLTVVYTQNPTIIPTINPTLYDMNIENTSIIPTKSPSQFETKQTYLTTIDNKSDAVIDGCKIYCLFFVTLAVFI